MKRKKILVCVNEGEHSKVTLKFAAQKANSLNSPIEILYVIDMGDLQNFMGVMDAMRKEKQDEAEKLIEEYRIFVEELSDKKPTINLREAISVGEEIINVIDSDSTINMVLLGASKESPLKNKLYSYLINQLGEKIMVPIMIIPHNLTELQIDELTQKAKKSKKPVKQKINKPKK